MAPKLKTKSTAHFLLEKNAALLTLPAEIITLRAPFAPLFYRRSSRTHNHCWSASFSPRPAHDGKVIYANGAEKRDSAEYKIRYGEITMGFFGTKRIECPKQQWTTLISNFGAGMPAGWDIRFTAKDGGKIEGTYREKRHWWIFPETPVTGKITEQMKFQRYWINAIYSLQVCPDVDAIAEID